VYSRGRLSYRVTLKTHKRVELLKCAVQVLLQHKEVKQRRDIMASVAADHFFCFSLLSTRLPIALLLHNRCSLSTLIAHVSLREGWIGTNYSGQSLEHCFSCRNSAQDKFLLQVQAVYMYDVSCNCRILVFLCSCSACNPALCWYSLSLTNCWNEKWWQWRIKNWLRGLSPRANYTDRATAVCQRS
jgi:hypothetical protein